MTCYLNFRSAAVGGAVVAPRLVSGTGDQQRPTLRLVEDLEARGLAQDRDVLLVSHGFNVSYAEGVRSLARLESELALSRSTLFIGVLWPGDAWLPVVNYPLEGDDASACGAALAAWCARVLDGARSLSLGAHSLGARLMLNAAAALRPRRVRSLCLMAGAVECDCLTSAFAAAADNCDDIAVLASHRDWVLRLAYRVGEPVGVLLRDHALRSSAALGSGGPCPSGPVRGRWQIPDDQDFGHGDYLPDGGSAPDHGRKWRTAADFLRACFEQRPRAWP